MEGARKRYVLEKLERGGVDAAATYLMRIVSLGLGFISQVMVARLLGISGYGAYAYALAWSNMVVQPSLLGFDRVLIRELAVYRQSGAFGLMRGLLRRSNQFAALGAVGFAAVVAAIALPASSSTLRASVALGLLIIPLAALGRVQLAALQGLKRVALGQLTHSVGRTIYFIVFLGLVAILVPSEYMSSETAVGMQALAFAAALISGSLVLRRVLPRAVMRSRPQFEGRTWAKSLPMLGLLSGLMVLNSQIGVIMLGAIGTVADSGRFNAALRASALVPLGLMAVGAVIAPRISELYATGKLREIERILIKGARGFVLALPPALFCTLLAPWFLAIFGDGFDEASTALVILALGQVFNAATGTVGVALVMTKHERAAMFAQLAGTCANVVLCALLIPHWHSTGAAVAASTSVVVVNLLYLRAVARRLGVRPGIWIALNPRTRGGAES